jgi:hypothetical protein
VKIGAHARTGSVIAAMFWSSRKTVLVGLLFPIGLISGGRVVFPQRCCEPV